MGSNLLDGRPAPVAPLGGFEDCYLLVRCTGCGRGSKLHIGRMMRRHRLPPAMRFVAVGDRLRCMTCGAPGQMIGVEGWKRQGG